MKSKIHTKKVSPNESSNLQAHIHIPNHPYRRLIVTNINMLVVLTILVATTVFYLFTQHENHLITVLPYGLFGMFILLHIFMHGGHSNGGHTKHGSH